VLRVRRIGVDGDGTVVQELDALLEACGLPLEATGALLAQPAAPPLTAAGAAMGREIGFT